MTENVFPADLTLDVHDLPPDQAVSQLIDHAVFHNASDLLFAHDENHVTVGMRHLGIYRTVTLLTPELGRHCMAHIKASAGIDFTEHRRPLDGRWLHTSPAEQKIDLRINVLPTLYGEDVNLRLLNRQNQFLALENLGLDRPIFNQLLGLLHSPSGLVLVAGPPGAGKTTTLYAALGFLNTGQRKINTIEDPIEYAIPGIRQAQVPPHGEVDFPELLRSVLRQAPDVIMIGEIRDAVTAETAVRAANSGHLVLATLHAPTAAGAIQSLQNLGVPPHFLGTSLRGVVAQRLVRTLCPFCRQTGNLPELPDLFNEVAPWLEEGQGRHLFAALGCSQCHQTGYAARTGVFEVMVASTSLRELILEKQPVRTLHRHACAGGMMDFRRAALLKIARGETTSEEVLRVIPSEFLGLDKTG